MRAYSSPIRESSLIWLASALPRLAHGFASAAAAVFVFLRFLSEVPPVLKAGLRATTAAAPWAANSGLENWMLEKPCMVRRELIYSCRPAVAGICAWIVPFSLSAANIFLQKSSLVATASVSGSVWLAVSTEVMLLGWRRPRRRQA